MSELKELQKALLYLGGRNVRKNVSQMSKVERAIAITKASETREGAIIAKRICQLEQQRAVRKQMGLEDSDDLYEKIKANEAEHTMLLQKLKAARGRSPQAGRVDEEEDDWSSHFEAV